MRSRLTVRTWVTIVGFAAIALGILIGAKRCRLSKTYKELSDLCAAQAALQLETRERYVKGLRGAEVEFAREWPDLVDSKNPNVAEWLANFEMYKDDINECSAWINYYRDWERVYARLASNPWESVPKGPLSPDDYRLPNLDHKPPFDFDDH